MTTKADYTEEEWNEIVKAPTTTGVLIITADPGVTSMFGEMKAMMKSIVNQTVSDEAQELVGALVEELQTRAENKEKMEAPELKDKGADEVLAEMLQQLSTAAAIVDGKGSEAEALGYKQWIMGVAEATAEAGREGGFLGIGSVRVSDKEKAAMEKISQALGLPS